MSELPQGWQARSLGGLTQPRKTKGIPAENADLPFIGMEHVEGHTGRILETADSRNYVSAAPRVETGDVLFGRLRPYLNKVALAPQQCFVSGEFIPLPGTMQLDAKFLQYRLLAPDFVRFTAELDKGDRPRVSWPQISTFQLGLPPLDEQRRIVEILDDHFSRLDAAVSACSSNLNRMERLRLALQHSIFESVRNGRSTPLSECLSVNIGGIWGGESGTDEKEVRVVRVTELKRHGRLDVSTAAHRSISAKQLSSRALQPWDLLLEKSGGGPTTPVGRVGLVEELDGQLVCANFMQLMRPDPALMRPRYLHLFLNYFHGVGGTVPFQTATTNIRNIKTKEYMQIAVPIPDLRVQDQIVSELESFLSMCDSTEADLSATRTKSLGLRRTLLHAAFTGQLTKEFRND